ncbi:MAG: hypothetical protein SGJ20_12540 [Planctomycetota bacterium]|nr:hypothetical protein [Planctomycetota bacterium]
MSEYQYIEFQAIDAPLTDKQLAFADKQSSRAEITRRSFTVEYSYSSFRGDVDGMLRNGYDVFLNFADYGVRDVRLRLPHGMPFSKTVSSKYINGDSLKWKQDKNGPGGILSLHPYYDDVGPNNVLDSEDTIDALTEVRQQLIDGDLRALYLLWLCACDDNFDWAELVEPPVPHGIADLNGKAGDLLQFFGLDPELLKAAGEGVPAISTNESAGSFVADWVKNLNSGEAKELLLQLLSGDAASEKVKILAKFRESAPSPAWPTTNLQRTFDALLAATKELRANANAKQARQKEAAAKRASAKAEKDRVERMKQMVKDPAKWLREVDQLVNMGGTSSYQSAAELLSDLRESIGGSEGDRVALNHAAGLVNKFPTRNILKSSLRKRGLVK